MAKYSFYGCSDDLFIAAKDGRDIEEIYPPEMYMLQYGEAMLVVCAEYGTRASVWSIGVEPFDEDVPLPDWPVSLGLGGRGYSAELTIEVPENTQLLIVNRDDYK